MAVQRQGSEEGKRKKLLQKRPAISSAQENINKIRSFKVLGLYVAAETALKRGAKNEEQQGQVKTAFDEVFEEVKTVARKRSEPLPKMSSEMKTVIMALNKNNLICNDDVIAEETEEIEKIGEHTENNFRGSQTLEKRPRWNNFVRSQIIPTQRLITSIQKEVKLTKEKQGRERELLKEKMSSQFSLPHVSTKTENLLLRSTSLDYTIKRIKERNEITDRRGDKADKKRLGKAKSNLL